MLKYTRIFLLQLIFNFFLVAVMLPVGCGFLAYSTNHGGVSEQAWLNQAIIHIIWLRDYCDDPELREVLGYTIQRYHRIGPFDVSVACCDWPGFAEGTVLGVNNPLVPGLTLDISTLQLPLHDGTMVLIHEALHDYPPYLGHSFVDPTIAKLEDAYAHAKYNLPINQRNNHVHD